MIEPLIKSSTVQPLVPTTNAPAVPTSPAAPASFIQSLGSRLINQPSIRDPLANTLTDLGAGAVKSATNTLQNVGNLAIKPLNAGLNAIGVKTPQTGFTPEQLTPTNTTQKIGQGVEQAAEFLVPEAKSLQVPGFANVVGHIVSNSAVRAAQGGSSGDSIGSGIISGALSSFAPLAEAFKPTILKGMSALSGFNENVLSAALKRTPEAISAVKNGEPELNGIVKKTASNLADYANETLQKAKDTVAELTKLSAGGKGYPGTRQAVLDEGRQFVSNIKKTLRSDMNIGVTSDGALLFNRPTMASNIVSRSDQSAIQDAYSLVRGISKDTSIKNIDSVLERMISLKSKTPVGTPTGGETRKIIGGMMDEVKSFTRSLGSFSPAYAKYADFIEKNLPERAFINDAKELFGGSKHLSPKETTQITTRLLQLFNSGRNAIKDFAGEVGQRTGNDIIGSAAGTLMNTGDQISIRAQNLTARGAATKILESVPRALVKNYVESGNLTNPFIRNVIKTTGVSANVLLQTLAKQLEGN